MGLLDAYVGYPTLARQASKAQGLLAQRDANGLADPKTYAFVTGLLGTPPDQLGFSAMHPDKAGIDSAAQKGYALGLLAQVAPFTKGLPVGASIKPLTDAERATRMQAMNMERGWWRGGQKIGPDNKRSGPWYTQDAQEAADYAKRFGPNADVREYAIPAGMYLEGGKPYSSRLAYDLAGVLDDPYFGKAGKQLATELRTYGKDEAISGATVWQVLESRFGNDGAAEVLGRLGAFKGVKGVTGGPEAYVFKNSPVRDANRAQFDPDRRGMDDIYGAATLPMLGVLGVGSAGLSALLRKD